MSLPPGLLALLTLAVGVAAWLRRDRTGTRGLAAALVAGGLAFAALSLLERAAAALPAASAPAASLRLAAVLAALVLWGALAVLAFQGGRRRDLFWIVPFGLLTLLGLADRTPSSGGALIVALPVVARWRWQEKVDRRALAWALFGALVLPLAGFLPVPGDRAAADAPGTGLVRYVAWARELAGLYLLLALPGLVRSWSLSIRRVGRRLGLLLLLSGVVPVLLVVLMWGFSTQLGVRAERALFATRLVQRTTDDLRGALLVARAADAPDRAALQALAGAHPQWPGLRLWRHGLRVRGDSLRDERALAAWPDSLPQHGLVTVGRASWLGARVAGPTDTLVALVPAREVLESDLQTLIGARLSLQAGLEPDSLEAAVERAAERGHAGSADSLARGLAGDAGQGRGLRLSVSGQPLVAADRFSLTAGHGLLEGIAWTGRGWKRNPGLLSVDLRWRDIALGLVRDVRENPFNYLPLAFIGLMAFLIVMIAGADFGMVRALGRSITAAVNALRGGAERLEAGDLAHRIPVEGEDELWDVAGAFNRMAVGLERGRQLEIERQRIEDELALARRIQARLLPPGPPPVAGLELAGATESAREVGGDYYDFLPLGDGRVALVIADVSGKGMGAALLMSGFRASLLSQDLAREDVAGVLARLNQFLHRSVEPGRFVTAFLAVLDGASGRLVYVNAGHNAPLLLRSGGALERLETGGLILGIMEHSAYETGETELRPGDRLVLFTDGVTEAASESDELWGEERLVALLGGTDGLSCAGVLTRIVEEVRRFEGARGASDDVTLIVARRTGA